MNPDGGEIFRTRPDRPWGPPSILYNGYRVFPGGKAARAWRWPPTQFKRRDHERVRLYIYSPCGPLCFVMGRTFTFTSGVTQATTRKGCFRFESHPEEEGRNFSQHVLYHTPELLLDYVTCLCRNGLLFLNALTCRSWSRSIMRAIDMKSQDVYPTRNVDRSNCAFPVSFYDITALSVCVSVAIYIYIWNI